MQLAYVKKNMESICWECARCDGRCIWVRENIVPEGATAITKGNKECTTLIVECLNFEKEERGKPSAWQKRGDIEAYSALRGYVVKESMEDYINAMLVIKLFGDDRGSLRLKNASTTKCTCERFFSSEYFSVLSEYDGKALAQYLRTKTNELWEDALQTVLDNRKFSRNTPKILRQNKAKIREIAMREARCKEL